MEPLNTSNYFELFSLPQRYQLDVKALSERYRELQARVHPDRVAGGSDQERIQAIQATSLLNEAFQTLKSEQSRAAYLLKLRDIDVERVDQADLDPELLLEQIRLREQLEEIPRDDSSLGQLESMRERIQQRLSEARERFAESFDSEALDSARKSYYEMQYLAKLIVEIESVEEDLLGY